MIRTVLLIAIVVAVAPRPAAADDTFVCRNAIVKIGMTAADVTARCGEPTAKASENIPIRARNQLGTSVVTGSVVVQKWTYASPGRIPALLIFEDGKLESIERGTQ